MPSYKTQGTSIFLVDTLSASVAAVLAFLCPTAATGLGGAADQIDDTCLGDLVDKSFTKGLGNPGQVNIPFVLKSDAMGIIEASHALLFDLKAAGDAIGWMIGLSDGTSVPTLDSNDALVAASGRSFLAFDGYLADLNIDIATNEVIRGTLTVQRSGEVTPYWKS